MKKDKFLNIFLSSIHQNAGKTTISLGLLNVLRERKRKITFMKPVGQSFVNVGDMQIDKDTYLIGKVFHSPKRMGDMSPITIGPGYTEKYIFNPQKEELEAKIKKSFHSLIIGRDSILVEGTGHAGVGSVIDFSNADVAKLLGSKAIIVAEGGIGKSIDEIILNKALFDLRGVELLGVIINKVLPEKLTRIKKILRQGLKNKGIRMLGCIPIQPLLSSPTVEQIKDRLNLKLLSGKSSMGRRVRHTIVAAMEPHNMVNYLRNGTLVLTSGDRIDNILLAVSSHLVHDGEGLRVSGIILTGGLMPNPKIVHLLRRSKMPILITDDDTYTVAAKIEHLICKIQSKDKDKIEEATRLVKRYVDVDTILKYA